MKIFKLLIMLLPSNTLFYVKIVEKIFKLNQFRNNSGNSFDVKLTVKTAKKLIYGMMILSIVGCSAILGDREYKSGVVDYRMVTDKKDTHDKNNSIIMKYFSYNDSNVSKDSYFIENDYIDIRLANIMYNIPFDPTWGKTNKNKLINNIGVFVTIKEINPMSDLNDTTYPDNTLIYVGNMYVKAKANQSFTPIYLAKYHGGDLQIQLDVVEFDKQGKDSNRYIALLNNIVELSRNAISNGLIGKAVSLAGKHYLGMEGINKLGNSLLTSFSKNHDDLITTYKLNLISANTVKNKKLHKLPYLKEGDIVFVRLKEGDPNNKTSNWKKFRFNSDEKIIEDCYEYKLYKNGNKKCKKLFKTYYSYIVLTLLKRDFSKNNKDSNSTK